MGCCLVGLVVGGVRGVGRGLEMEGEQGQRIWGALWTGPLVSEVRLLQGHLQ